LAELNRQINQELGAARGFWAFTLRRENLDLSAVLCHHRRMLGETKRLFALTRAVLSTSGRAKPNSYQAERHAMSPAKWTGSRKWRTARRKLED